MPEVVLDEVLLGESVLGDVVLSDSASSEALPSAEVPPGELPSPDASAEGESESSPVSAVSGAEVLGAAVLGVAASEAAVSDVAVSEAPAPCAAEVAGGASDTPSGADPPSPPQAAANSDTKTRTASQQRILDKNSKAPPHAQPPAEKPDADLRTRTFASFSVCISINTILRKGVMGMWQRCVKTAVEGCGIVDPCHENCLFTPHRGMEAPCPKNPCLSSPDEFCLLPTS